MLDQMLADVRRGKFDVILCLKLDRLGRSLRHLVNLADELRTLGVDLVTAADGIDTTTSHGRMMFGILATIAEFERERLRERTFDWARPSTCSRAQCSDVGQTNPFGVGSQ